MRYTFSQGCSSESGHCKLSFKVAMQRAEARVVDRKLGRNPLFYPI